MLPVALIVLLAVAADSQSSASAGDLRPPSKAEPSVTTPQGVEPATGTEPTEATAGGMQLFGDDPESELNFFKSIRDQIRDLGVEGVDDDDDDSKENDKKSDDDGFVSVKVIDLEDDPSDVKVRRQGDFNPEFGQRRVRPGVEFDEPPAKVEDRFPPPPLYPPRSEQRPRNRPDAADGSPLLQLTQGGYRRPYDSPEQENEQKQGSESPEMPKGENSNQDAKPRVVEPQVSYTPSFRPSQFRFGPGPILRSPFAVPARSFANPNSIIPTTVQNAFLNTPPAGFTDYMNFQAQFPAAHDDGGYSGLRDHSVIPLFQSPGGILFQGSPQYQQIQPVVVDPSRTLQEQFLSGSYETVDDASRPDYAAYFRHPTPMSPQQFQVPANFYGAAFDSPLGNFRPSSSSPFSPRFIRYPSSASPDTQQPPEIQRPKEGEETPDKTDSPPVPFGTRLQVPPQSNAPGQTDSYMRYPMREAGYATEESLPSQNGTGVDRDASPRAPRRFFPRPQPFGRDPYRDAMNVLQQQPSTSSQSNRSYETSSPETFFRGGLPPFGVPQGVVAYPDRNRDFSGPVFYPAFQNPDARFNFQSPPRPDAESGGKATPACALKNNASVCFEDEEYPRQEVLFSLNAEAPLLRRFTAPAPTPEEEEEEARRRGNGTRAQEVCGTEVRRGAPLRARNAAGVWKVLVGGDPRFEQPVALELCRSPGEPCSHAAGEAAARTSCVQKFGLQSLLAWSMERGVHSDLFRLPVACTCRLLGPPA